MIGSEKHSFSPQPSGEQENETLKKKETPEHAEECFDWNEEITRLREDFKQQHESRHLENTKEINQFNQMVTDYENLSDYLVFEKAPPSKETSSKISQEHIEDLGERIRLLSKGDCDNPELCRQLSQITAEAGQIATGYFKVQEKDRKLVDRYFQTDSQIKKLKKTREKLANLPWLKKIIFYRKHNQLNAKICALETERNQIKKKQQDQYALEKKIYNDTEVLRWALKPDLLKVYIDNMGKKIDSDYTEMSQKLATPELIRSLILDQQILPNMHKIEDVFSQPLRPEQRQAYLQCVIERMPLPESTDLAPMTTEIEESLKSNLQKQESLTDLPPAFLDSLVQLPGQVGAWKPVHEYQEDFNILASMAAKKEKDEIKKQLKHPLLEKLYIPTEYDPVYFSTQMLTGWSSTRKLAEKTGLAPLSILEDREEKALENAKYTLPSEYAHFSNVKNKIVNLIEIGSPVAIPHLLSHIKKAPHHTRNELALSAITDLFRRAEPEKLSAVLTPMSPDDQDLVRIITDPHAGINSFSDKFSHHGERVTFIQRRGPALVAHEKNLSVLANLGESEEDLSKFFFFTSPQEALSQLKKVSEATRQPYTEKLKEALPLLDIYLQNEGHRFDLIIRKKFDKASLETLPLVRQWAKELNIPYPELLRQLPKYLIDVPPERNVIMADLIKPGNTELGTFLPGFAQDQLKISPELVGTLATLCQQSDFLENPELRQNTWLFLHGLTRAEDGKEVLESCLKACQDPTSELTNFHKIGHLVNIIHSLNERMQNTTIKNIFLHEEKPAGNNLSDIFIALEKSLALKLTDLSQLTKNFSAYDKTLYEDDWQKANQILDPEAFKRLVVYLGGQNFKYLSENRKMFLSIGITSEQFQEITKLIAYEKPPVFISYANRGDWQSFLGEETFRGFLDILPTGTDEKRNAFTHNAYDRTSALLLSLAGTKGFSLHPENFQIIQNYVKEFGLAKIPKLFEYFHNLNQLESGQIPVLPPEQIADGTSSIEELKNQFENMSRLVTAEQPYLETSKMSRFQQELLSLATGFATHRFSSVNRPHNLGEIITQFSRNSEEGKSLPIPKEYQAKSFTIGQVEYLIDQSSDTESGVGKPFNLLASEILTAIEPAEINVLRNRATELLNKKVDELQETRDKKPNPFISEQLEKFSKIREAINQSQNLDKLMENLLDIDRVIAKKLGFLPLMREIVFRRVFEKQPPSNLEEVSATLRRGISAEGILEIIGLIDELVKEHALNLKNNNTEAYWTPDTFNKIKQVRENSKLVDLSKIFADPLKQLKTEQENFKAKQKGTQIVKVIPDRGLIGELSGYIANACYTKEYPLLRDRPNLVPYKFVAEDNGEFRLMGSVLAFELTQDNGDKVMLMRAFNVPDESSVGVSDFIEKMLNELARVGRERGLKRIIVPGTHGTISNYTMANSHIRQQYVEGKQPISLAEKFNFNNYDLTNDCFTAREIT